jgi:hypothetical protein
MTLATFTCPKCNGTGSVSFKHIADGRCFLCAGNGTLVATEASLAKCAKLGLAPRNELPANERCTLKQLQEISRLAARLRINEAQIADRAGVNTKWMDDERYQLSRKDASRIIEYGRAA